MFIRIVAWHLISIFFLVVGDEYDACFLGLSPYIAVVMNLDWEHVDIFPNEEAVKATFRKFLNLIRVGGHLILCGDRYSALSFCDAVGSRNSRSCVHTIFLPRRIMRSASLCIIHVSCSSFYYYYYFILNIIPYRWLTLSVYVIVLKIMLYFCWMYFDLQYRLQRSFYFFYILIIVFPCQQWRCIFPADWWKASYWIG